MIIKSKASTKRHG